MVEQRTVLREIAWRDLFPWLILVRVFRLAIYPSCLLVALLGVIATPLGWRLGEAIFRVQTESQVLASANTEATLPNTEATVPNTRRITEDLMLAREAKLLRRMPGDHHDMRADVLATLSHPLQAGAHRSPIVFVFNRTTQPLRRMYDSQTSLHGYAYYLFGAFWSLAVWAFCGGLISRLAVVELGREEQANLKKACQLTVKRWFDYFTAPLYPLLGTAMVAMLSVPVGWMLQLEYGTIFAGLLWIFVLIGGAISAFMLLWLFIGFPLMYPAISAEETGDSFEAMSRSFAYAFQKPLNYLFYAFIATLLGFVAWSVVDFLCVLAIDTTHWSVSWGAGSERVAKLWHPDSTEAPAYGEQIGMQMIGGIEWIIHAINEAFAYSFFWVSASAIYLLLRLDVDHTEFDEVWSAEDVPRYPLPSLVPDKDGVPVNAEPTVKTSEASPQIEPNQAE